MNVNELLHIAEKAGEAEDLMASALALMPLDDEHYRLIRIWMNQCINQTIDIQIWLRREAHWRQKENG